MGKTIFFIVLTSLLIMVTVSILSLEVKCYQLARVTQDLIILIEFKEPSLMVSFPPVIRGSYNGLPSSIHFSNVGKGGVFLDSPRGHS